MTSDGSLRTTPWQRREVGGVYVGHDRSVWVYRELPLAPLKHEDPARRLQVGASLESILEEVGARSKDVGQGIRALAQNRQVHIACVTYLSENNSPDGSPELLDEFLDEVLQPYKTSKSLLVGVKLRSSAIAQAVKARGVGAKVKAALTAGTENVERNLDGFADDFQDIDAILRRGGGVVPSERALAQLECWWNFGLTPDVTIAYDVESFDVAGAGTFEIRAVSEMPTSMAAPFAQWLLDAMTHPNPATAISIRADLEPHTITRSRLRKQRRRLIAQEEEEAATGDLAREENSSKLELAGDVESLVVASRTPWLANTSILMAKRIEDDEDDYADFLASAYQIKTVPLVDRQLEGLDEFQPTSTARVSPFPQDLNPAMVAYAGLASFSNLGDTTGVFLGHVDPDDVPCYVDPYAASRMNTPPVMGVFGDPGSGKALPVDSLVLTEGGWARNGDLVVGDRVYGSDGRLHDVLGVYPQGEQDIYRVTFSDGSHTDCTLDHLWSVATSGRLAKGHGWQVRSLQELLDRGIRDGQGKAQWRIPIVDPIQFPTAQLPIDPYLLGILIGDGNLTHFVNFSTADAEILEAVRAALPAGLSVKHVANYDYQIQCGGQKGANLVKNALVDLGLFGLKSNAKFLPQSYLAGDVAQRTALLQGLVDSDGEITKANSVIYTTVSRQLADGVTYLVQSLGGTVRRRTATKSYRHNGEKRQGQLAYLLTLCLPASVKPARLARKADAYQPRKKYLPSRRIENVELVGRAHAQCIKVSAPDRLYVTEHMVLTHNTFASQLLAGQAALAGNTVFFVNPKPMDSLAPWAQWVEDQGAPARVVSMSKMEERGGAFDPFGFCADPQTAAEVLTRHIQTVLGKALEPRDEWTLSEGLSRGAAAGARCAYEALEYVQDKRIVELVHAAASSNSLVALAFSKVPATRWGVGGGLTLIEFDRELALPKAGKFDLDMQERVAVAAMRLVSRASLEMLLQANGGVLVIDEAHHYIGSPEGLASMDKLAREGRSMGILPIFITQRPSDLLKVDMEGFMSRVLCMKLKDPAEATAALQLCMLQPTQNRIDFLREAGPRPSSEGVPGRPALGILRDLRDQHAVVTIGPVPEELRLAMSTNRTDRELRAAMAQEQQTQTSPTWEVAQ